MALALILAQNLFSRKFHWHFPELLSFSIIFEKYVIFVFVLIFLQNYTKNTTSNKKIIFTEIHGNFTDAWIFTVSNFAILPGLLKKINFTVKQIPGNSQEFHGGVLSFVLYFRQFFYVLEYLSWFSECCPIFSVFYAPAWHLHCSCCTIIWTILSAFSIRFVPVLRWRGAGKF